MMRDALHFVIFFQFCLLDNIIIAENEQAFFEIDAIPFFPSQNGNQEIELMHFCMSLNVKNDLCLNVLHNVGKHITPNDVTYNPTLGLIMITYMDIITLHLLNQKLKSSQFLKLFLDIKWFSGLFNF